MVGKTKSIASFIWCRDKYSLRQIIKLERGKLMSGRKSLKRAYIGFEIELFTLNSSGEVVGGADAILNQALQGKTEYLKQECAKNMLEIVSSPHEMVPGAMSHLLTQLEYAGAIARKNSLHLLPLGCYPGLFNPSMRTEKRYAVQQSLFGEKKFRIAGRCVGFHCHYTLPKGMFDGQLRMLKLLVRSKIKDSLVNSYNFAIAIDPCLATFMQSSPYYQGRHLGKDSRMIMYRGGEDLESPHGMYADLQEFGGLPMYKLTAFDILDVIKRRYERWKSLLIGAGINLKALAMYQSILSLNWSPVKVNPNGTLEQRGMDMNHLEYIAGVGVFLKSLFRKLQEEHYAVVPSEMGIREPFKVEKDVIYIPPYSYVRSVLQKASAYEGLENDELHCYCRRLFAFAQKNAPKDSHILLEPIKKMIRERKTVSDHILDFAKKRGYGRIEPLPQKISAEIALTHSHMLQKSIERMQDTLQRYH